MMLPRPPGPPAPTTHPVHITITNTNGDQEWSIEKMMEAAAFLMSIAALLLLGCNYFWSWARGGAVQLPEAESEARAAA